MDDSGKILEQVEVWAGGKPQPKLGRYLYTQARTLVSLGEVRALVHDAEASLLGELVPAVRERPTLALAFSEVLLDEARVHGGNLELRVGVRVPVLCWTQEVAVLGDGYAVQHDTEALSVPRFHHEGRIVVREGCTFAVVRSGNIVLGPRMLQLLQYGKLLQIPVHFPLFEGVTERAVASFDPSGRVELEIRTEYSRSVYRWN
jgi:hypothetical protein